MDGDVAARGRRVRRSCGSLSSGSPGLRRFHGQTHSEAPPLQRERVGALLDGGRTASLSVETQSVARTPSGTRRPTPPATGRTGAANHGQSASSGQSRPAFPREMTHPRSRKRVGQPSSSQSVSVGLVPPAPGTGLMRSPVPSYRRRGLVAEDRSNQPPSVTSKADTHRRWRTDSAPAGSSPAEAPVSSLTAWFSRGFWGSRWTAAGDGGPS